MGTKDKTRRAIVVSEDRSGLAQTASLLGYVVETVHNPSLDTLMQQSPDLILISWAPSMVRANSKLVRKIRSVSMLADVPIGVFYSFESDLSTEVLGTSKLFAFLLGTTSPEEIAATIRKITGEDWPTWPPAELSASLAATAPRVNFVDESRLQELRSLGAKDFDPRRLVRLVEELNNVYSNECFIATGMLVRAIADHVPPMFGCKSFSEVANNYVGGGKSFRDSMRHLDNSLRKIADSQLHVQIRKSEVLLNRTQVDFRADLDVLLAEVVRLMR